MSNKKKNYVAKSPALFHQIKGKKKQALRAGMLMQAQIPPCVRDFNRPGEKKRK